MAVARRRQRSRRRRAQMAVGALALVAACARRPGPGAAPNESPNAAPNVSARAGAIDDGGRVVRVALGTNVPGPRLAGVGEWRLYDERGRVLARVSDAEEWRVERRGTRLRAVGARAGEATEWRDGPLVARPIALGAVLAYDGKRYRGELWAHPGDGGSAVTVVNRVAIEEYLRGVVPLELNTFAPPDAAALEAQAVAARSYTYSRMPEFQPRAVAVRQAARPFDVRSTVSDQVYGGVGAERPATDRAIRATAGLVIRYAGAVVSAPYHSTCGGSTAEPRDLWGGDSPAEPYLVSVSDRVPGAPNRHYCDVAPRFRWSRQFDVATLDGVLRRYLRAYASGGHRAVRSVRADERTPSGRVAVLAVTTDAGRLLLRGNDIRFALRSADGEILPSTYFSVEPAGGDGVTRVTLRGNGNGHGVGMCQWGAVGRARAGHDFRAILRAYYPGTTIEPAE